MNWDKSLQWKKQDNAWLYKGCCNYNATRLASSQYSIILNTVITLNADNQTIYFMVNFQIVNSFQVPTHIHMQSPSKLKVHHAAYFITPGTVL